MKTELFPYQLEGVQRIERFNGRSLVADEMGLGKSLEVLTYLHRNKGTMPAVVVCPASVKYVWEHEALIHFDHRASVLEGTKPSRNGEFRERPKLTILNYDILQYWLPYLKRLKPKTIILDECQSVANRGTIRTKKSRELCRGVPHVIALSGTPLTSRPAQLWTTLNIIRPDLYPSFFAFGHRYCGAKRTFWGWDFNGATKIPELHQHLISHLMIRRRKCDVLKDLPEKIRQIVPCDLSDRDEYNHAERDFLGWLRNENAAKLAGAKRATAMVKVGYLLRLVAKLKLKSVVRWSNQFFRETDEKLILFATHRKMIEALQRRCKVKSVTIDGGVSGPKRKAVVEQFQKDSKTRLFIGNIRAAGVGINLTAASNVVFAELDWVPGNLTQAEDRPHRIGQKKTVWIYYLVAGGTIEERLCKVLWKKQGVTQSVLDGRSPTNDFNVFNKLLESEVL